MPDGNELSDQAKKLLQNVEIVDMAERGRELAKQREVKYEKSLAEPEERKKSRREILNLAIALIALLASFYSVFVTHRDAQENLYQTQRAYVGPDITINADSTFTLSVKAKGPTPANHVTADFHEKDAPDVGPKIRADELAQIGLT